jgi:voltage-gated potassium channel Kch
MLSKSVLPALLVVVVVSVSACGSLSTASDSSKKVVSAVNSLPVQSASISDTATTDAATTDAPSTTAPPDPLAAPLTKSGTGDAVIKIPGGLTDARIVTSSHSGSANYVIETLDSQGADLDLLVNTIGAYKGTVLMVPSSSVAAFKITADGAWTFQLRDVRAAQRWSGASPVSGAGDQVLVVPGGTSGLTTVKISNTGEGNFVVYATDSSDRNLVVNEIGHWTGTEALPDGTVAVDVLSDGKWSIAPVA